MLARTACTIIAVFSFAGDLCAQAPAKLRTDLYGDTLPDGAISRLGTTRWRHDAWLSSLAYSPDGKILAFGGLSEGAGQTDMVRLCDAKTGRELRSFGKGFSDRPFAIAFSPDGTVLAVGTYAGTTIWEVATGNELRRIPNYNLATNCLAFSPDGKQLATGGSDGTVYFWNSQTGEKIQQFQGNGKAVAALAFTSDGRTLGTIDTDRYKKETVVSLWETTSGKLRSKLPSVFTSGSYSLAFCPDGRTLIEANADTIRIWDTIAGQKTGALELPMGVPRSILGMNISPDGKLLAIAAAHPSAGLTIWDLATHKMLRTLEGHELPSVPEKSGHIRTVRTVAFAPSVQGQPSILASGGVDATVRLWDPLAGMELNADTGHAGPIRDLAFRGDGQLLTISDSDRSLWKWDTSSGKGARAGTFAKNMVFNVAPSPNGKWLAVSEADTLGLIQLFDTNIGKVAGTLRDKPTMPLAFLPGSEKLLAWEIQKGAELWDVSIRKLLRRTPLEIQPNVALTEQGWIGAVSADGKHLAMRVDHPIGPGAKAKRTPGLSLLDLESGMERWTVKLHRVDAIAFSPNSKVLAEAVGDVIHLRNTSDGGVLHQLSGKTATDDLRAGTALPHRLAFTPDGKVLIAGNGGRWIFIWDAATGREIRRFQAHRGCISCVRVAPDGKTFAAGSEDTTAMIWQMPNR